MTTRPGPHTDEDHTAGEQELHAQPGADFYEELLDTQRHQADHHDPGETFNHVVDRIKHFTNRESDADPPGLDIKLRPLQQRDGSIARTSQGEGDQRALERIVDIGRRLFINRSEESVLEDYGS